MTLHTVMPMELVLQGFDVDPEATHEVQVKGIKMEVIPVAPGMGRIVRLLDCTLNDYLNPQLNPGSIVHYGSEIG